MSAQAKQTKLRILEASCAIFAKHGYNSVTARMIAEEAGIRSGTIYYHFKNKETLYIELFKWILNFDQVLSYDVLLKREPDILKTPSGKSYAIQLIVGDYFHRHLHVEARWKRRLVLRELFEHSPIFHRILNEILKVESNKMMEFYFLLRPTGSIVDAYLWSHMPDIQMLNHMMGESILESDHDPEFVAELKQKISRITTLSMIAILDLPIPEMLRD